MAIQPCEDMQRGVYDCIQRMYSRTGLPTSPIFSQGWLNFGYWKGLDGSSGSERDRARASEALYEQVFERMRVDAFARVLEVGCGRGLGSIALSRRHPGVQVCGIDLSADQIAAANSALDGLCGNSAVRVSFSVSPAERLEFPDCTFTHVYSIEAVQHFYSLYMFLAESRRVLVRGGRFCMAAPFTWNRGSISTLGALLPTVAHGLDNLEPIHHVVSMLERAGFHDIWMRTIGGEVFGGFDAWLRKTLDSKSWGVNWYRAYEEHLIEYVLIEAEAA